LGEHRFEALGGIRYTRQDMDLDVLTPTPQQTGFDENWIDPFIGGRYGLQFGGGKLWRWRFSARLDVGGFDIGAKITYHSVIGLEYRFNHWLSAGLGVKHLYVDYESGTKGSMDYFAYEAHQTGALLGLGFRF
jgi:hypothetical protein